jgi:hypothetical protein
MSFTITNESKTSGTLWADPVVMWADPLGFWAMQGVVLPLESKNAFTIANTTKTSATSISNESKN